MHVSFNCPSPLLFRVKSCFINGTGYSQNAVVVCAMDEDTPNFGKIIEFIIAPLNKCYFIVKPSVTLCFNSHFHAYEVMMTDD